MLVLQVNSGTRSFENRILKGQALGGVLLKPLFRGMGVRKYLDVVAGPDLLSRINVDQHGHFDSSSKMLGPSLAGSLSVCSLSAHRALRFSFAVRS